MNKSNQDNPISLKIDGQIKTDFTILIRTKIVPWVMGFKTEAGVTIEDCRGGRIHYGGGALAFAGTPRDVFWRFIGPCIEEIVTKSFDNVLKEKELYPPQDIKDAIRNITSTLKIYVGETYRKMADVDRNLRGNGFPQNIEPVNVEGKIGSTNAFIDKRANSIVSHLKTPNKISIFYNHHTGLINLIGLVVAIVGLALAIYG